MRSAKRVNYLMLTFLSSLHTLTIGTAREMRCYGDNWMSNLSTRIDSTCCFEECHLVLASVGGSVVGEWAVGND